MKLLTLPSLLPSSLLAFSPNERERERDRERERKSDFERICLKLSPFMNTAAEKTIFMLKMRYNT